MLEATAWVFILLGILFLAGEILAPGFKVLGTCGVLGIVWGILLFEQPGLSVHLGMAFWVIFVVWCGIGLWGIWMILRARDRPLVSGVETLIGRQGCVEGGEGLWVRIQGERWQAESLDVLQPGDKVEVIQVRELVLVVRKVGERS
ncbi:MAG: hypothetical protein A3J38_10180 [Gammaproteobacteria bacterium RIFCSPHIGHO2_12_FULL_45_9]|nr:MAG: hypothetical protein A3J38_10180 [Gammaproteobacteria bacterium RIFCSPHIGHO2_12_FULL_45_9]